MVGLPDMVKKFKNIRPTRFDRIHKRVCQQRRNQKIYFGEA